MSKSRTNIHVVYNKAERKWRVVLARPSKQLGPASAPPRDFVVDGAPRKQDAVLLAIEFARMYQPSSLRIHGRDGRIQQERTYPRSSDPRRTKG